MINKRKNRVSLGMAAVFFSAAVILTFFMLVVNKTINIEQHALGLNFDLVCIGLTISIVTVLVLYYLRRRKFDFFEFPVWFTLNIYIQVILNIWLLQRDYRFYSPWLQNDPGKMAVLAILLMWGGLAIVWAAYFWGNRFGYSKSEPRIIDQSRPRLRVMGIVWVLTWLVDLFATISGAQGYLYTQTGFVGSNYLFFISLINDLVTFNLLLYYFRTPTKWGRFWIIFVCSSRLLIGLILGTKGAIFIFIYIVMCYFYARGRLPRTWLVVGVIAVLFTVPVVNTFRVNLFSSGYNRSSGASFFDRIPILQKSIVDVLNQPLLDSLGQTQSTFEGRQGSVFEVTAAFLAVHPTIQPFAFFELVGEIATGVIPRFIWLDKPTARPVLYNISTTYLGAQQETSFADTGQIADAYRAGGVVFLLLWLVFITFIFVWLYRAGPGRRSISGTGFYLIVLTGIITYSNDIYSTVLRLLQFGIILFIFNKYVFFKKPKSSNYKN